MKKTSIIILIVFVILIVFLTIFFSVTPTGKEIWNNWFHRVREADDNTNYETIKKVEDTCRSMISSYNSDKLTYEQYRNNENKEKQEWAEQAKLRANKTASTYNNYILKNNYIWKNNIPNDIYLNLPYIE